MSVISHDPNAANRNAFEEAEHHGKRPFKAILSFTF